MCCGTRIHPLVGDNAVVTSHIFLVKETNIDILAIFAKWEGVLVKEELTEFSIVLHHSLFGGRLDIATHLIDDLLGLISRDIVERNE